MCFGFGICVGGNDDVSAGTSVDDDVNINLNMGFFIREGNGLGCGLGCRFWGSGDAMTVSKYAKTPHHPTLQLLSKRRPKIVPFIDDIDINSGSCVDRPPWVDH